MAFKSPVPAHGDNPGKNAMNSPKATEFSITNKKLYVADITLSTKENIGLLKQLESGFKCLVSWNS